MQRTADQADEANWKHEEQPDREHEREDHCAAPGAAGQLLLALADLDVDRRVQRAQAHCERLAERHDPTQQR